MIEGYRIAQIPLHFPEEREQLRAFLARHQLRYESDIQSAFGIYNEEDVLVGCGCAAGYLMKCFAVEPDLRGQNALGLLVSYLMQERFSAGYYDLFVITRAHNEELFSQCSLFPVVRTGELVLLENRKDGPERFASEFWKDGDGDKQVGAIVMNCNPFTMGHLALVEYAAQHCDVLHLFVVEEDRSEFPTRVRLKLVQEGTKHLDNVRVHLSGPYMISAATFPTYFLKKGEDAAALQTELDIALFAQRIAPELNIKRRFAGAEPLDATTARYNRSMRELLPTHGIEFCEIPRVEQDGTVISASRVRKLLKEKGVCDEVIAMVAPPTAAYLKREFLGGNKATLT